MLFAFRSYIQNVLTCQKAPLDYEDRSKGNVQLAILKLAGKGNGNAVFHNPGGPGDDPVEDVLSKLELLRAYVGNDSDIIVVVPRGVSATFPPMTCDATALQVTERLLETQNTLPGYDQASLEETYAIGESLRLDCAAIKPDLIPYIGTVFVANDMEYVRNALGQEKLSYYGTSYGTALGGTYAALFPDRVGRIVLDGVLDVDDYYNWNKDPNLDIGDADAALEKFFTACHDAGKAACSIWSKNIDEILDRLYQADKILYTTPLPVTGLDLLTWPLWRFGVFNALYNPLEGFPLLAGAVSEVLSGSAGPYIEAYMHIVQEAASSTASWPTDPKTGLKNSPNAGTFISCSDSGGPGKKLQKQELVALFSKYNNVSSYFGGISLSFPLICNGAELPSKARLMKVLENINTANPILFVGNAVDPTTPIRAAYRMSAVFNGSRVLTINGTGHISYRAAQDPTRCASKWITLYFVNGTLPPEGTVCDGMQKPFAGAG